MGQIWTKKLIAEFIYMNGSEVSEIGTNQNEDILN